MNNKSVFDAYASAFRDHLITLGGLREEADEPERSKRLSYYQTIKKSTLLSMSKADLSIYLGGTWAVSKFWMDKNVGVGQIVKKCQGTKQCETFISDMLFSKNGPKDGWEYLQKNPKRIGTALKSELLAYYYPKKYAIINKKTWKALGTLKTFGARLPCKTVFSLTWNQYVEACKKVKVIEGELSKMGAGGNCFLVSADNFLWRVGDAGGSLINYKKAKNEIAKRYRKAKQIAAHGAKRGRGKPDWKQIAAEKERVGLLGEALVLEFEREKLFSAGREDLAKKVLWSATDDDSLGYDIESFIVNESGEKPIFIEVKTTTLKGEMPFFVSKREMRKSKELGADYFLYRISECDSPKPKLSVLRGPMSNLGAEPATWAAKLGRAALNSAQSIDNKTIVAAQEELKDRMKTPLKKVASTPKPI